MSAIPIETLPRHLQEKARALLHGVSVKPVAAVDAVKPRLAAPKKMNKTETRYALRLEALKFNGEIADFAFEGITLQLAPGIRYTPDFFVWREGVHGGAFSRIIECHETKGFMREAARVRLLTAASLFPCFTFKLCRYLKGVWQIEPVEVSR